MGKLKVKEVLDVTKKSVVYRSEIIQNKKNTECVMRIVSCDSPTSCMNKIKHISTICEDHECIPRVISVTNEFSGFNEPHFNLNPRDCVCVIMEDKGGISLNDFCDRYWKNKKYTFSDYVSYVRSIASYMMKLCDQLHPIQNDGYLYPVSQNNIFITRDYCPVLVNLDAFFEINPDDLEMEQTEISKSVLSIRDLFLWAIDLTPHKKELEFYDSPFFSDYDSKIRSVLDPLPNKKFLYLKNCMEDIINIEPKGDRKKKLSEEKNILGGVIAIAVVLLLIVFAVLIFVISGKKEEKPKIQTTETIIQTTIETQKATANADGMILGDSNGDSLVDTDDAVLSLKKANAILMGEETANDSDMLLYDVNKDGTIDSDDSVLIIKYVNAQMLGDELPF